MNAPLFSRTLRHGAQRVARAPAPAYLLVAVVLTVTPRADAQPFFFETVQIHPFSFDLYPTSMALGDIDGDGNEDLVLTGRTLERVIVVMRGTSTGTFLAPTLIDMGSQTEWALLEDFDGDDTLDLVIAKRTAPGIVAFMHGFGDGTFGEQVEYVVGRNPVTLEAVDLDGDGDLDVAVVNNRSNSVTTLFNDGNGNFALEQTVLINYGWRIRASPYFIAASDLDLDGDPDLVITHHSTGYVVLLLNDGSGHLMLPRYLKVGGPVAVAPADADNDGDPDLLFSDLFDFVGKLNVLSNTGDARFVGPETFVVGGWTWYIAAGDLDGNGTVDAVLSDAFNGHIHLLSNEGASDPVEFSEPQTIGGLSFPRHVLVHDLDGDGDLDLLVADIASQELHVLHNETPQGEPGPGGPAAPPPPVARNEPMDPQWQEVVRRLSREMSSPQPLTAMDVLDTLREWGPQQDGSSAPGDVTPAVEKQK